MEIEVHTFLYFGEFVLSSQKVLDNKLRAMIQSVKL